MEKATLPGPTITIHDGPGFDLNANQGPRVLSISLALIALSGIAVTLRFLSRLLSKAGLWWDDWVVLGALFISWGPCICMIVAVRYGFGKHIEVAGPNPNIAASRWFKILYVFEVFYTAALAVTKYSIMLFYWRIFKTPHFKAALITIAVLVTAWFIAIGVAGITECLPVSDLWEVFLTGRPGRRISLSKFFLGSAIPNIITDWTLLVMPLPLVWRLRIPNSQKIGLTTIFLLGGFVCVVSIVRLVVLDRLEQVDVTWNFVDAAIWSAIEPTIGIVSACMPMMYPLIKAMTSGPYSPSRTASRRSAKDDITSLEMTSPQPKPPQRDEVTSTRLNTTFSPERGKSYGNHVTICVTKPLPRPGGDGASWEIGAEELAVPPNAERIRKGTSWLNRSHQIEGGWA